MSPSREQRQRTGGAGPAAFTRAWVRAVRSGLVLAAIALPALAADRTPLPAVAKAKAGSTCVLPAPLMRREHMNLLKHQRDDTVHAGVRGTPNSLKGCVECHASAQTGSVARADGDFCVGCHRYAAVKIDCFECHASRPAAALAQGAPR